MTKSTTSTFLRKPLGAALLQARVALGSASTINTEAITIVITKIAIALLMLNAVRLDSSEFPI